MTTSEHEAAIQAAIPHRPPMLLIDEIIEQTKDSIKCGKTFRVDEYFVQGHFPDYPLVPGVILCECCLQAGAILLSALTPQQGAVPVATRIDNAKFKKMVRPGESVELHVTLNDVVSTAYFLSGRVLVGGKLAARLDFACTVASPES